MSDLENAIQLIHQGRRTEAQLILQALIKGDPRNISAWFWYVETCTSTEKRIQTLEMCLKMNSGNPQVTQALQKFRSQLPLVPAQPEPPKPAPSPSSQFSYREEPPAPIQNNDRNDYGSYRSSYEPEESSFYYSTEEKKTTTFQDDYGYDSYSSNSATPKTELSRQRSGKKESFEYVDNSLLSKNRKPAKTYGVLDIWLTALTQDLSAYESILDDPKASIGRAFTWVAISGLVSALTLPFIVMFNPQFSELSSLPEFRTMTGSSDMMTFLIMFTCAMLIFVPIMSVINLAISGGIQNLVAGFFGGMGDFTRTIYALAAFTAPVTLLTSIFAMIPIVGQCLGSLLGFYTIVLNIRALRAAHSLSAGAAIGVLFAPGILVIIFACVIVLLAGGMGLPQQ